ncbi:unnamed protein product [Medioppia subpectinata]|uniref:Lipase domain-containing protein n=1 Tax=Medioppia subpectinata TaxID=1979941 RepID=A0A7R9PVM9_9ACAR|nr:unnamed protein product [Medioppia subpectinata]CAG2101975.1 unnamed protein product [Medioppia subpectinata]
MIFFTGFIGTVYFYRIALNGIVTVFAILGTEAFLFWSPRAQQFNTKFNLYTRRNPAAEQTSVQPSDGSTGDLTNFNNTLITKLYVHGYGVAPANSLSSDSMKNEWLNAGDYNVFIVDWSEGNHTKANIPTVAQAITKLITELQSKSGLDLDKVHIVGHSLGAHIAGLTGKAFNGRIGRISGLDPAGPGFNGKPTSDKLSPSDAQFVDAIHTDAVPLIGLGINENSGHIDFYPNGGNLHQPGCFINRVTEVVDNGRIKEGLFTAVACNHFRSVDLFVASINPNNPKGVATQCSNFVSYLAGGCNVDAMDNNVAHAILGEQALLSKPYEKSTIGHKYYLTTTLSYPFFRG